MTRPQPNLLQSQQSPAPRSAQVVPVAGACVAAAATSSGTTPSHAQGPVELLAESASLYEQLHKLAMQQGKLIQKGDNDGLLSILAQRQELIDRLADANRRFTPLKQRWDRVTAELSSDQRRQVNQLLDRVDATRRAIIHQDEQDAQQLRQSREMVAVELRNLSTAGQAMHAYHGTKRPVESRFTDQKG